MQTFRFTGSYSINTHNSLKHKAISRFYPQLILYASFCAPYKKEKKKFYIAVLFNICTFDSVFNSITNRL